MAQLEATKMPMMMTAIGDGSTTSAPTHTSSFNLNEKREIARVTVTHLFDFIHSTTILFILFA